MYKIRHIFISSSSCSHITIMIIKLIVKNINFFIKLIHLKMNNVYIINTNITNKKIYKIKNSVNIFNFLLNTFKNE